MEREDCLEREDWVVYAVGGEDWGQLFFVFKVVHSRRQL